MTKPQKRSLVTTQERTVWLREWLTAFRTTTPRADRQKLIDSISIEAAIAELPLHYRRLVYVLAARALQYDHTTFPSEARVAILDALSRHRPHGKYAAQDLAQMMLQLREGHAK